MTEERRRLDELLRCITASIAHLPDETADEVEKGAVRLSPTTFWAEYTSLTEGVSKQATMLAITYEDYDGQTSEEGNAALLTSMQRRVVAMGEFVRENGRAVRYQMGGRCADRLLDNCSAILRETSTFVGNLRSIVDGDSDTKRNLQRTGVLWERCASSSSLPHNSSAALITDARAMNILISDATREVKESCAQVNGENTPLLQAVLDICRNTQRLCLTVVRWGTLVNARMDSGESSMEEGHTVMDGMDKVNDTMGKLSELVDEVVIDIGAVVDAEDEEERKGGSLAYILHVIVADILSTLSTDETILVDALLATCAEVGRHIDEGDEERWKGIRQQLTKMIDSCTAKRDVITNNCHV